MKKKEIVFLLIDTTNAMSQLMDNFLKSKENPMRFKTTSQFPEALELLNRNKFDNDHVNRFFKECF